MGEPLKIYENEAAVVAPLLLRAPGVYSFPVELRGNALVSTIYVDTLAGATITAVWKDHNPLTSNLYTVHTHGAIVAGYNREFIAEATHGVAILEITVAGGSPTFGAFATANALMGAFASPDSTQRVTGSLTFSQGSNLTTGKIENETIAAANTEQSHTFPTGTRTFFLKPRGSGKIKLSYDNGTSGTVYLTVNAGGTYRSPEFDPSAPMTIYFQSPVAGLEIELESWS